MELLPSNDVQSQFLHNMAMISLTAGAWLIFALVGMHAPTWPVWVALIMMLVFAHAWSSLFFWDLYLRAWFFPESELKEDDKFELAFQKWMKRQGSNEQNIIFKLNGKYKDLDERLHALEEKDEA